MKWIWSDCTSKSFLLFPLPCQTYLRNVYTYQQACACFSETGISNQGSNIVVSLGSVDLIVKLIFLIVFVSSLVKFENVFGDDDADDKKKEKERKNKVGLARSFMSAHWKSAKHLLHERLENMRIMFSKPSVHRAYTCCNHLAIFFVFYNLFPFGAFLSPDIIAPS